MKQALLIIDVQNDYFQNGKCELVGVGNALKQTVSLQHYFRARQLPIFYIQHIKPQVDADFFAKDSEGAKIHPQLLPIGEQNEYLVIKQYPNSFYQTNLQSLLQQNNIKQLVICGMMTHMCVDSTTRAAAELGYNPLLIHDACATRDLNVNGLIIPVQYVQRSFMAALTTFAKVITTDELIA